MKHPDIAIGSAFNRLKCEMADSCAVLFLDVLLNGTAAWKRDRPDPLHTMAPRAAAQIYTNGESLPLQFPPANEGEGRTAVVRNHVTGKGKALAQESKGDFGPSYDAKGRHDMCLLY